MAGGEDGDDLTSSTADGDNHLSPEEYEECATEHLPHVCENERLSEGHFVQPTQNLAGAPSALTRDKTQCEAEAGTSVKDCSLSDEAPDSNSLFRQATDASDNETAKQWVHSPCLGDQLEYARPGLGLAAKDQLKERLKYLRINSSDLGDALFVMQPSEEEEVDKLEPELLSATAKVYKNGMKGSLKSGPIDDENICFRLEHEQTKVTHNKTSDREILENLQYESIIQKQMIMQILCILNKVHGNIPVQEEWKTGVPCTAEMPCMDLHEDFVGSELDSLSFCFNSPNIPQSECSAEDNRFCMNDYPTTTDGYQSAASSSCALIPSLQSELATPALFVCSPSSASSSSSYCFAFGEVMGYKKEIGEASSGEPPAAELSSLPISIGPGSTSPSKHGLIQAPSTRSSITSNGQMVVPASDATVMVNTIVDPNEDVHQFNYQQDPPVDLELESRNSSACLSEKQATRVIIKKEEKSNQSRQSEIKGDTESIDKITEYGGNVAEINCCSDGDLDQFDESGSPSNSPIPSKMENDLPVLGKTNIQAVDGQFEILETMVDRKPEDAVFVKNECESGIKGCEVDKEKGEVLCQGKREHVCTNNNAFEDPLQETTERYGEGKSTEKEKCDPGMVLESEHAETCSHGKGVHHVQDQEQRPKELFSGPEQQVCEKKLKETVNAQKTDENKMLAKEEMPNQEGVVRESNIGHQKIQPVVEEIHTAKDILEYQGMAGSEVEEENGHTCRSIDRRGRGLSDKKMGAEYALVGNGEAETEKGEIHKVDMDNAKDGKGEIFSQYNITKENRTEKCDENDDVVETGMGTDGEVYEKGRTPMTSNDIEGLDYTEKDKKSLLKPNIDYPVGPLMRDCGEEGQIDEMLGWDKSQKAQVWDNRKEIDYKDETKGKEQGKDMLDRTRSEKQLENIEHNAHIPKTGGGINKQMEEQQQQYNQVKKSGFMENELSPKSGATKDRDLCERSIIELLKSQNLTTEPPDQMEPIGENDIGEIKNLSCEEDLQTDKIVGKKIQNQKQTCDKWSARLKLVLPKEDNQHGKGIINKIGEQLENDLAPNIQDVSFLTMHVGERVNGSQIGVDKDQTQNYDPEEDICVEKSVSTENNGRQEQDASMNAVRAMLKDQKLPPDPINSLQSYFDMCTPSNPDEEEHAVDKKKVEVRSAGDSKENEKVSAPVKDYTLEESSKAIASSDSGLPTSGVQHKQSASLSTSSIGKVEKTTKQWPSIALTTSNDQEDILSDRHDYEDDRIVNGYCQNAKLNSGDSIHVYDASFNQDQFEDDGFESANLGDGPVSNCETNSHKGKPVYTEDNKRYTGSQQEESNEGSENDIVYGQMGLDGCDHINKPGLTPHSLPFYVARRSVQKIIDYKQRKKTRLFGQEVTTRELEKEQYRQEVMCGIVRHQAIVPMLAHGSSLNGKYLVMYPAMSCLEGQLDQYVTAEDHKRLLGSCVRLCHQLLKSEQIKRSPLRFTKFSSKDILIDKNGNLRLMMSALCASPNTPATERVSDVNYCVRHSVAKVLAQILEVKRRGPDEFLNTHITEAEAVRKNLLDDNICDNQLMTMELTRCIANTEGSDNGDICNSCLLNTFGGEKTYAILVGGYESNTDNALRLEKDLNMMQRAITNEKGMAIPRKNVMVVKVPIPGNSDGRNILLKYINDLKDILTKFPHPRGRILLYLTGHGYRTGDEVSFCLGPMDSDQEYLKASELKAALSEINAKELLVISDFCLAGQFDVLPDKPENPSGKYQSAIHLASGYPAEKTEFGQICSNYTRLVASALNGAKQCPRDKNPCTACSDFHRSIEDGHMKVTCLQEFCCEHRHKGATPLQSSHFKCDIKLGCWPRWKPLRHLEYLDTWGKCIHIAEIPSQIDCVAFTEELDNARQDLLPHLNGVPFELRLPDNKVVENMSELEDESNSVICYGPVTDINKLSRGMAFDVAILQEDALATISHIQGMIPERLEPIKILEGDEVKTGHYNCTVCHINIDTLLRTIPQVTKILEVDGIMDKPRRTCFVKDLWNYMYMYMGGMPQTKKTTILLIQMFKDVAILKPC